MATTKPSGLKISRSGTTLTYEWTIPSGGYDAQEAEYYHPKDGKWKKLSGVGKTSKKATHKFDATDFTPHTSIKWTPHKFKVRGKKKGKWSAWADKDIKFSKPDEPTVTLTPGNAGSATIAWTAKDEEKKPFSRVIWEAKVIGGSDSWNASSYITLTGGTNSSVSGSATVTYSTGHKYRNQPWTLKVRLKAQGRAGDSDWVYAKYIFATPYTPILPLKTSPTASNGSRFTVRFMGQTDTMHPVDYYLVQYLIDTPTNTSTVLGPLPPLGASWTDAQRIDGSKSGNHSSQPISIGTIPKDKAVWTRVVAYRGSVTAESNESFVYFSGPPTPQEPTLSYDGSTHKLTLGVQNPSQIPDSYMTVTLPDRSVTFGHSETSKTIDINLGKTTSYTISAYCTAGKYVSPSASTTVNLPEIASNPVDWAPIIQSITKGTDAGSVVITWKNLFSGVTTSEVSFATNSTAWSSGTYETRSFGNVTSATITGLEYDVDYWFAVRVTKGSATSWSAVKDYKLKTQDIPQVKSLALGQGDGKDSILVSWNWAEWPQAESLELSWADNPNAWASNKAATSVSIPRKGSNGKYYIHDLERNQRWYVRASYKASTALSTAQQRDYFLPITPVAPATVTFDRTDVLSRPRITWAWTWDDATEADISWSTDPYAWNTQSPPSVTTISDRKVNYLDVDGLETGVIWYCRVVLQYEGFSAYKEASVDLRTAPTITSVTLSKTVIPSKLGTTDISWRYNNEDGTEQNSVVINLAEVDEDGAVTIGRQIASIGDASTSVPIYAEDIGLEGGNDYWIVAKATSTTGMESEWSTPVNLVVTNKPEASITSTSLAWDEVETNPRTYTGDVVTFDGDAPIARSLKVGLEPIQDLHGYDKPWVGGAGKNLANLFSDGKVPSISSGALVNANGYRSDFIPISPNTDYTFSLQNRTLNTYVFSYNGNKEFISYTLTVGVNTFTSSADTRFVMLRTDLGSEGEGQLELGSTATDYEPYENICPISGRTEVETRVRGFNQWGEEWEVGAISVSSGLDTSGQNIRSKNFIPIMPNTSYYLMSGQTVVRYNPIIFYDANKNFLSSVTQQVWNTTITTPSDARYMRFYFNSDYGTTYNHDISINYPSTDTEYHPYVGNDYTTSLGRTVYGGTLDVVSGELTVDRAMVTLNGAESIYMSNGSRANIIIDEAYLVDNSNQLTYAGVMCDRLPSSTWASLVNALDGCAPRYGHGIAFKMDGFTTVDQWRAYLSENPMQISYELATPQTYQLTPQQVELLTGTNHVWSDGQITLKTADSVSEGWYLKDMPLTLNVTGVGNEGTVSAYVERSDSYFLDRPDEKKVRGHEGELIAISTRGGDGGLTISELKGTLDDGAKYRLVALVKDDMGQTDDASIDFTVMWNHQAIMPDATVEVDNGIVKITPTRPEGAENGDYCEIYRLSADYPELIVPRAEFGTTYVDPYPTLGEFGGHRIVYRTRYNDFITADGMMAVKDFLTAKDADYPEEPISSNKAIIDFGGDRVELQYNIDVGNKWEKDFIETQYLGGSVQGDWNPAVRRTSSVGALTITIIEQDAITAMRRLAEYSGQCHVRTPEGSSFTADVQVSENRSHDDYGKLATFDMDITRVDPYRYEGVTLEEWQA